MAVSVFTTTVSGFGGFNTPIDDLGNTWSLLTLNSQGGSSCTGSGGLPGLGSFCTWWTISKAGGADRVLTFCFPGGCSASNSAGIASWVDQYRGVGNTNSPSSHANCGSNGPNFCPANGSDAFSPALTTTTASQIVYETAMTGGGSGATSSSLSANSGQTQLFNEAPTGGTAAASFQSNSCNTACPSVSFTNTGATNCPASCLMDHAGIILIGTAGGNVNAISQCYGECGNPAITLINPNATHPVAFNQSWTLFYEFQSNLNGFLINVTTNVAKPYTNGMQVGLGAYAVASCPAGTQPFSLSCPGALQSGFSVSNPNIGKGQFSIQVNGLSVVAGEWLGIAITGLYTGLDLNETNGVCSDGVSGICSQGMFYTKGTIPQTITTSSLCSSTAGGSPCNFAGMSKTGLWAWITGNTVTGLPPPTPSCVNSDLSCFLALSICGLTPSNCAVGAIVYLFGYFGVTVFLLHVGVAWVKRETDMDVYVHPAMYPLIFWAFSWMFFAIGVLPLAFIIIESSIVIIALAALVRARTGIGNA